MIAALIADDDEFFRVAIERIICSKLQIERVFATGSLDEAIEQLAANQDISLGLFDLAMPGMESAASLRAVRESFDSLKVVVVSASRRREDILLALEAGAHGFVPKGLGSDELVRALNLILAGDVYVPSSITQLPPAPRDQEAAIRSAASGASLREDGLTPRQRQVLQLLTQGMSNKEIARNLGLSDATVKVHMAALLRNLGVKSRSAAAVAGARMAGDPLP